MGACDDDEEEEGCCECPASIASVIRDPCDEITMRLPFALLQADERWMDGCRPDQGGTGVASSIGETKSRRDLALAASVCLPQYYHRFPSHPRTCPPHCPVVHYSITAFGLELEAVATARGELDDADAGG